MTNAEIAKAIKENNLIVLGQLTESHPRKEQPPLSNKELQEQLLALIPKQHPEFWNMLADYYYRLTKKTKQ